MVCGRWMGACELCSPQRSVTTLAEPLRPPRAHTFRSTFASSKRTTSASPSVAITLSPTREAQIAVSPSPAPSSTHVRPSHESRLDNPLGSSHSHERGDLWREIHSASTNLGGG